jgi:hypothetical protein
MPPLSNEKAGFRAGRVKSLECIKAMEDFRSLWNFEHLTFDWLAVSSQYCSGILSKIEQLSANKSASDAPQLSDRRFNLRRGKTWQ